MQRLNNGDRASNIKRKGRKVGRKGEKENDQAFSTYNIYQPPY